MLYDQSLSQRTIVILPVTLCIENGFNDKKKRGRLLPADFIISTINGHRLVIGKLTYYARTTIRLHGSSFK